MLDRLAGVARRRTCQHSALTDGSIDRDELYCVESIVMHGVTPTCCAMLRHVDHGLVTLRQARSSWCVIIANYSTSIIDN